MSPNDRPPPDSKTPPSARRGNPLLSGGGIILAIVAVVIAAILFSDNTKAIDYSEFRELVDAGQLKKFTLIGTERAKGEVRDPSADPAARIGIKSGKFEVNLPHADD